MQLNLFCMLSYFEIMVLMVTKKNALYLLVIRVFFFNFIHLSLFFQGYQIPLEKCNITIPFMYDGKEEILKHGSVVVAAITSCTNTSNPSVMLGAG